MSDFTATEIYHYCPALFDTENEVVYKWNDDGLTTRMESLKESETKKGKITEYKKVHFILTGFEINRQWITIQQQLIDLGATKIIGQKEMGQLYNRVHWQIYVNFKKALRPLALMKKLSFKYSDEWNWFAIGSKSLDDVIKMKNYCKKETGRIEGPYLYGIESKDVRAAPQKEIGELKFETMDRCENCNYPVSPEWIDWSRKDKEPGSQRFGSVDIGYIGRIEKYLVEVANRGGFGYGQWNYCQCVYEEKMIFVVRAAIECARMGISDTDTLFETSSNIKMAHLSMVEAERKNHPRPVPRGQKIDFSDLCNIYVDREEKRKLEENERVAKEISEKLKLKRAQAHLPPPSE